MNPSPHTPNTRPAARQPLHCQPECSASYGADHQDLPSLSAPAVQHPVSLHSPACSVRACGGGSPQRPACVSVPVTKAWSAELVLSLHAELQVSQRDAAQVPS